MVDEIFNISIVCDNLKDGNEYFDVTITTDSPLVHIDNNVASVRINDLIGMFTLDYSICLYVNVNIIVCSQL